MTFSRVRTLPPVRRATARGLAAVVAGLLAAVVVAPAPASARTPATSGSLEEQRQEAAARAHRAAVDLDESSALVRRATAALLQARADLADAEAVLARTRGELDAARARDRRMQARLEAAQERLAQARRALAGGQAAAAHQAGRLTGMAAQTYEQGGSGLAGLSVVLSTQDPSELARRLSASSSVLNSEAALLDRLTASRVLLDVQEQETAEAEAAVARRREDAAANLERKRALEAQAADAASAVAQLVEVKADAHESALAVRSTDLRQRDRLQAERDRITALIGQQASMSGLSAAVDGNGYLSMPAQGWITSPFGWRTHPIFGGRRLHTGIDLGAPIGATVHAAASGTVLLAGPASGYGTLVVVGHGDGVSTAYAHLSAVSVRPGQSVHRGEKVGEVGNEGNSTGPHLHFEVRRDGEPVDPSAYVGGS